MLRDIFKQAYIWSEARGRHMSEKYRGEQVREEKEIRNIQKNMTFMNYMNKKNWKSGVKEPQTRGTHLAKNKEVILQMEREGSPQQGFLKKCLDDAIDACIREKK